MANMKLNYLHVHFLLRLACACPMTTARDPGLFRVSTEMLGLVVETIMLKDQIINSGTSLVWKVSQSTPTSNNQLNFILKIQVAYYGLSAAGLICLTLVNQGFATEIPDLSVSKVFQDLSILVGEIERGTLVYIDSPNFALLARAAQTIKSLLDRMLTHSMAAIPGTQPDLLPDSEPMATLEGGSWGLWDSSNLQDFEINFWHNLADHPFLND